MRAGQRRSKGHLLMQMGMFYQGHRAAADMWATVNLLGSATPDGKIALVNLLQY